MKVTVYEGRDGLWYWRLRAPNGLVVADGGEGYTRAASARRAVRRAAAALASAEIVTER